MFHRLRGGGFGIADHGGDLRVFQIPHERDGTGDAAEEAAHLGPLVFVFKGHVNQTVDPLRVQIENQLLERFQGILRGGGEDATAVLLGTDMQPGRPERRRNDP